MSRYASLEIENGKINEAVRSLVAGLLEKGIVQSTLVPALQPFGGQVMQTLFVDPGEVGDVDPLAPVVPANSATLLAKLTRKEATASVAAFLRSCEVRAFLELVKLKQATREGTLVIGIDCYGRYETRDYSKYFAGKDDSTAEFLTAVQEADGVAPTNGCDIVTACKSCDSPVADAVDLRLVVIGVEALKTLVLEAVTPAGEEALTSLGWDTSEAPAGREDAVSALIERRSQFKKETRDSLRAQVGTVEGLMEVIGSCINCYNCRGVCPVCYCRECVFSTDSFSHDGRQYFNWAKKRGRLRMPSDTLFYQLTRMAHMSTLCVGCGQCSSACPNDIPLAELFGLMGDDAQAVFGYVPGRSLEEPQPLASFKDGELFEVTGQVK